MGGTLIWGYRFRKMELYPNFTIAFISKHMKAKASNWALPEGGSLTTMPLAVDDDARGWAAAVDNDDARGRGRGRWRRPWPRPWTTAPVAVAFDDNARGCGRGQRHPWPRPWTTTTPVAVTVDNGNPGGRGLRRQRPWPRPWTMTTPVTVDDHAWPRPLTRPRPWTTTPVAAASAVNYDDARGRDISCELRRRPRRRLWPWPWTTMLPVAMAVDDGI